ncbi:MAG: type II 3-dehydroquinate dehydratase [Acidimicrobiia bacterium]|nr:type II 3-dehydroquinate dehydratase [Acidimicrobiia bacterium]
MRRVLVINGPNLNLLGTREPEIYGSTTLNELEDLIRQWGEERQVAVSCFQSNHEGEIIDRLHDSRHAHDGVIINAGALTHYSYALHDAIAAVDLPSVEVHISNITQREEWRHSSVIEPACSYMIRGRGIDGYRFALDYLVNLARAQPLTIAYGVKPDQVGDLLIPDGAGPHSVAVLLHGGFWRDHWTRDIMQGLAIDLHDRGWASWNLEYRRVGTGGGWPTTAGDVASGIEHLAAIADVHNLDLDRLVVIGHSAGGHLALWSAAPHSLADRGAYPSLVVALAPISDLEAGYESGVGSGAVANFLELSPAEGRDRYDAASPANLLPLDTRQLVVHGTEDDTVPVTMSRTYVAAARAAGDDVAYRELDDVDHMSLINPATPAWQAIAEELIQLS